MIANALPRFSSNLTEVEKLFVAYIEAYIEQLVHFKTSPKRLVELRKLQSYDEVLGQVLKYVCTRWLPHISSAYSLLRPY